MLSNARSTEAVAPRFISKCGQNKICDDRCAHSCYERLRRYHDLALGGIVLFGECHRKTTRKSAAPHASYSPR